METPPTGRDDEDGEAWKRDEPSPYFPVHEGTAKERIRAAKDRERQRESDRRSDYYLRKLWADILASLQQCRDTMTWEDE